MGNFFTTFFYQPIFNLLIFIYNNLSFQDLGISIVILIVIIKAALWPLSRKSIKSQKELQDLQPKLDELKIKYKDDKVGLSQATMDLYKDNKINPFSSCLPLLIQFPFLIAVFQVFKNEINGKLDLVYSFISKPETVNMISFGFLDLSKPNIYLAVLAGLAQFWQSRMMLAKQPTIKTEGAKDENMAAIMSKQMMYFMPVITIFIGLSLPGGLTLYWFFFTLLTVAQQLITFNKKNKETKDSNKKAIIEGEIIK